MSPAPFLSGTWQTEAEGHPSALSATLNAAEARLRAAAMIVASICSFHITLNKISRKSIRRSCRNVPIFNGSLAIKKCSWAFLATSVFQLRSSS